MDTQLITLNEVAARLGRSPEQLNVDDQGTLDWAGRPAVPVAFARAMVEGYEADLRERADLKERWESYAALVIEKRREVWSEAASQRFEVERKRAGKRFAESGVDITGASDVMGTEPKQRATAAGDKAVSEWNAAHALAGSESEFLVNPAKFEEEASTWT
ncbi:MAG: hypothetical protein ACXWYT_08040 [Actinomycetota bacterium]